MNTFEAIVLGIVQGLTEFLPVSSSGHLVLLQRIFGISGSALFFDTMVHVGTLLSVFVVLWPDILGILKKPFQKMTWLLIMATLPTVVIALLFKDLIEQAFHTGSYIAYGFFLTAILLLVSETLSKKSSARRGIEEMNILDALFIGTLQGLAIMPAVSRSGSTISGALFRKLDRDLAARFSFLLSIPAILGASVLQIKDLFTAEPGTVMELGVVPVIAGSLAAALVGFFAVRYMLKLIRKGSLKGFAVYVAVLGVLVLLDQLVFRLFF